MNLPATWSHFSDTVDSLLEADADRMGAETFITQQKRQACIEIQEKIPRFVTRHEQNYSPDNFTTWGDASLGALPFDAAYIDSRFIRSHADGGCHHHPVEVHSWSYVTNLVGSKVCGNGINASIAVDRNGGRFVVFPKVLAEDAAGYANKFLLIWSGLRFAWGDNDNVPFNEKCAQAVADYVKARIYLHIERRPDLYAEHMKLFNSKCGDLYSR